jgi:C-terminal processing protease CtpA/Prc
MRTAFAVLAVIAVTTGGVLAQQPRLDSTGRARAKEMLNQIKNALRNDYYDKTLHGLDLNQHFKAAEAKIDAAVSQGHAYAVIAQALIDLNDSHTFFLPPDRPAKYEWGWTTKIVGEACYVVAVKPGSDAAAKGVKPGDRVLQLGAFQPVRDQLWRAQYLYRVLSPRAALDVVLQAPGGQPRQVQVAAKVTPRPKDQIVSLDNFLDGGSLTSDNEPVVRTSRAQRIGDVAIWKLESFNFNPDDVDPMFDVVVKDATALVIDVRGNPGGLVKTLERVVSRLFDRDVKIADAKGRKSNRTSVAQKRKNPFAGKVVVLTDAESASAAEVLARVVQLEERGRVIGDRSSGSVMESLVRGFVIEVPDTSDIVLIPYGASITEADLIMKDGRSLEHVGVTPDDVVLPTADDLRDGRDPALARAVTSLGGALTPADAGRLFPIEWK